MCKHLRCIFIIYKVVYVLYDIKTASSESLNKLFSIFNKGNAGLCLFPFYMSWKSYDSCGRASLRVAILRKTGRPKNISLDNGHKRQQPVSFRRCFNATCVVCPVFALIKVAHLLKTASQEPAKTCRSSMSALMHSCKWIIQVTSSIFTIQMMQTCITAISGRSHDAVFAPNCWLKNSNQSQVSIKYQAVNY